MSGQLSGEQVSEGQGGQYRGRGEHCQEPSKILEFPVPKAT